MGTTFALTKFWAIKNEVLSGEVMSCKLKEGRCKGFEMGYVHCNESCEYYEMPTISTNRWNDLTEVSPPVNKEVELKIVINGEERIYTDRLIPMVDCTYIWQYGDYSGCDGEAAWRYISKQ